MKKTSSTQDLLAKLGDSLKSSPLTSHARYTQNAPQNSSGVPNNFGGEGSDTKINSNNPAQTKTSPLNPQNLSTRSTGEADSKNAAVSLAEPLVVSAQNIIVAPKEVHAQIKEASQGEATKATPPYAQKEEPPASSKKPSAPSESKTSRADMDAMMEKIIAMGKILSPQKAQLLEQDWKAKKAARTEEPPAAKTLPVTENPASRIAYATTRNPVRTQAGWKGATVGLYAADYEKIREVMDYVQTQTGEMINLSRVVKIALRALPINQLVVDANTEVKKSDRRATRGL